MEDTDLVVKYYVNYIIVLSVLIFLTILFGLLGRVLKSIGEN